MSSAFDGLRGIGEDVRTQKVVSKSSESKGIAGGQSSSTFVKAVQQFAKKPSIDTRQGEFLLVVELEQSLEEVAFLGKEALVDGELAAVVQPNRGVDELVSPEAFKFSRHCVERRSKKGPTFVCTFWRVIEVSRN